MIYAENPDFPSPKPSPPHALSGRSTKYTYSAFIWTTGTAAKRLPDLFQKPFQKRVQFLIAYTALRQIGAGAAIFLFQMFKRHLYLCML